MVVDSLLVGSYSRLHVGHEQGSFECNVLVVFGDVGKGMEKLKVVERQKFSSYCYLCINLQTFCLQNVQLERLFFQPGS